MTSDEILGEMASALAAHKTVYKYDVSTDLAAPPVEIPAGPNSRVVFVGTQGSVEVWVEQDRMADGELLTDRIWLVKAYGTGKVIPAEWEHIGSSQIIVPCPCPVSAVTPHGRPMVSHLYKFDQLDD